MDPFSSFELFRRRVDQMFSDFDQQMFGGDVFDSPFASQPRLGQQSQPSIGHEKSTNLSSSGSTPSKEDQERVIPLQGGGGVGKGGSTSASGATGGGSGGSRALTTRPLGGGALSTWGGWPSPSTLPSLKMDLIEEKDRFLINADVPGFNKEQLKLNINNGMLTVSGETSTSKEEQDPDRKYHRVERSSGSIYRQLRLPENIKEDQISATCENGVLKLTLPKDKDKEEQRERSIKVQ
jgi:HSP20 family molecular chaperone IbpA